MPEPVLLDVVTGSLNDVAVLGLATRTGVNGVTVNSTSGINGLACYELTSVLSGSGCRTNLKEQWQPTRWAT